MKLKQRKPDYKWVILVACFIMEFFCLGFCSGNKSLYLSAITEALDIKRSLFAINDSCRYIATAVLNRWVDEKQDMNSRLPYLRTYMGHRDLAATAYYIHLLPEHLVKSAGIDWESMGQIFPRAELWEK